MPAHSGPGDSHKESWAPDYPRYGGTGVKVEASWMGKRGFMVFVSDLGVRPSPEHEIGRYGDVGNYVMGNCKWMDPIEQAQQRS